MDSPLLKAYERITSCIPLLLCHSYYFCKYFLDLCGYRNLSLTITTGNSFLYLWVSWVPFGRRVKTDTRRPLYSKESPLYKNECQSSVTISLKFPQDPSSLVIETGLSDRCIRLTLSCIFVNRDV